MRLPSYSASKMAADITVVKKQMAAGLICKNLVFRPESMRAQFSCPRLHAEKRWLFFDSRSIRQSFSGAPVCVLFVTHYIPPRLY